MSESVESQITFSDDELRELARFPKSVTGNLARALLNERERTGVCGVCGFPETEQAVTLAERIATLEAENARLREAVVAFVRECDDHDGDYSASALEDLRRMAGSQA